MTNTLENRCQNLIVDLGLGQAGDVQNVTALTGGVASDIASVVVDGAQYCVKFALPKLKVAADWRAPVHRNAAEYAWLTVAADLSPESAVKLYGRSETAHGFVMEFIAGDAVYLWKNAMLDGRPLRGEAQAVGDMLGRIHAASAQAGFDRSAFQNRDDFRALRIEPYLTFTAHAHPDLANILNAMADGLYENANVLVHGDVSPKNILIRDGAPILLDAECATMGDASFDPAFCLNHLILKAIHVPTLRTDLLAAVGAFWDAYGAHISWEDTAALEERVARLLPALMLARVDGKSPVEYLDEVECKSIRNLAVSVLKNPISQISELVEIVKTELKEVSA